MRKELIVLSCLLVFLSACVIDSGSTNQQNWRSGTQGIVMSFVQNSPPSEVVSRSNVVVVLEYSNKGAATTSPTFYLGGFDSNILPFGNTRVSPGSIGGKDQYNIAGSQPGFLKWETGINLGSLREVDSFKQYLSVTACYPYQTLASPIICVDPQKYEYIAPARCDFDVKELGSRQGGPMAVTEVKQKATTNEIFLEIHVENKGSGTPYLQGDCLTLGYEQVDQVSLAEVTMSGRKFSCSPSTIRLVNGKGYAICSLGINVDSYYETPLTIRLNYNYRDTLPRKEITIINVDKK